MAGKRKMIFNCYRFYYGSNFTISVSALFAARAVTSQQPSVKHPGEDLFVHLVYDKPAVLEDLNQGQMTIPNLLGRDL
jgi:hypothetical protein